MFLPSSTSFCHHGVKPSSSKLTCHDMVLVRATNWIAIGWKRLSREHDVPKAGGRLPILLNNVACENGRASAGAECGACRLSVKLVLLVTFHVGIRSFEQQFRFWHVLHCLKGGIVELVRTQQCIPITIPNEIQ